MFASHINRIRSGFIAGAIAALLFALPSGLFAQSSPLTVVPSTGKVGVANTYPQYPLDVTGTVNATAFRGDGSQLTGLPTGGGGSTDVQIFTTAIDIRQLARGWRRRTGTVGGSADERDAAARLEIRDKQ
jgi:hypothetical protein